MTSHIAQRRALARANDDADYRLRRAELIEAAAHVFRRKGYQATTLKDIAEQLGVDRAALYYYTSGKDELFQEIVAEAVQENVAMVEALRLAEGPADRKIASFIIALLRSYERHFPYLFVYIQEPMTDLSEDSAWNLKMRRLMRRFDDAVRGIIQAGLDEGSLTAPVADARLIANGIIGMCNWCHRWLQPNEDAQMIGENFAAMVLDGLVTRNR